MTLASILGKNYKWWYLFVYGVKSGTAYNLSNLFWIVSEMVTVLGVILVWFVNKNEIYTLNEVMTYFIIGQMFLLGNHAITQRMVGDISTGKITSKLLLPSNLFLQYIVRDFGYSLYSRVVSVCIYFVVALFFQQYIILPQSLISFVYFYIFVVISFWITSFIELALGSLTFFSPEIWSLIASLRGIFRVASGAILPLNIVSFTLFLTFLPFSYTFYHPMQMYLGKLEAGNILNLILGGVIWGALILIIAIKLFKLGLKHNESVGL
jgi:ABC-2 type transport system permease protein